jgi:transcriptional regulator with PAS, ATPase and Fis domain
MGSGIQQGLEDLSGVSVDASKVSDRDSFISKSDKMKSILEMVDATSSRKSTVLITGETGVGKELIAREIHSRSKRADNVFVPVNCSTFTGDLFESQMFGHVKGAFTGALYDTLGFFRAADNGTIFLDEIGETPINQQAKLLRVLQEQKVTPLGATKSHPVDVRVICASNRNLTEMIGENRFRSDLFYRLNVININIPPLRERRDDILPLARYFLKKHAELYQDKNVKVLSRDAEELVLNYSWPGNVRELENAIESAYVLTPSEIISSSQLPVQLILPDDKKYSQNIIPSMREMKYSLVTRALEYTGGRKIEAAKILGIDRRKLNRILLKAV